MKFECSLDNERYTPCGEGRSGQWTRNVQDGRHNFKVKGTDNDGNVVEAEVTGWLVDTIAPTITFSDAPAKTNDKPLITWTSSEEAVFECSLDGGEYKECDKGMDGEWSESSISDGVHTLSVRGKDNAGNVGSANRHTWIVGKSLTIKVAHFSINNLQLIGKLLKKYEQKSIFQGKTLSSLTSR